MNIKEMGYSLNRVDERGVVLKGSLIKGSLIKGSVDNVRVTVSSLLDNRAEEAIAKRIIENVILKFNILSEYLNLGWNLERYLLLTEEDKVILTIKNIDEGEEETTGEFELKELIEESFIKDLVEGCLEANYNNYING